MHSTAASGREQWESFRKRRHESLGEEFGWLTLTSLQWLNPEPRRLDLVPGVWRASGGAPAGVASLTATEDDGLMTVESGETVNGTITAQLANEESLFWVSRGSAVVELGVRGGRYLIRTRDSAAKAYTDFSGVPVFDYDPDFVVDGQFESYPVPHVVTIGTAHPEVSATTTAIGAVTFKIGGQMHRLVAARDGRGLALNFYDQTNGASTAEWRKVTTEIPQPDGTVSIDFNRAVNYPSAFTAYGTCPRPIGGNRIAAAINAGEKIPAAIA